MIAARFDRKILNKELMKQNKTILRLKDKISAELYTLLITESVLRLSLKREWYEKIASGEKTEEYREITPYWLVRFIDWRGMAKPLKEKMCESLIDPKSAARWNFDNNYCGNRHYDYVIFENGYGNVPTTVINLYGVTIKTGYELWGAVAKQFYFTLQLGNVLYSEPCS